MPNSELFDLNVEYNQNVYHNQEKNIDIITKTKESIELYTKKNVKISLEEIYVGNVERDVTYDELFEFLSRFGKLEYLNMIYDKNKNRPVFKGYGFARYHDKILHTTVLNQSNMFSLRGKKVILGEKLGTLILNLENYNKAEEIESSCWFCYKNPNIDKDLIIKDFKHFYIAFAKGPINNHHYIIIPKNHNQCYITLSIEQKQEFYSIIQKLM